MSAAAAPTTTTNSAVPVDVGSSDDFKEGCGHQVDVSGRSLSIFRHGGKLYALDHHCYHAGGPLANGDIEDLVMKNKEHHPCVICPWHRYKISLKTGEGIYLHSDPFCGSTAGNKKPKLKSKGKKQRTHQIWEDDDDIGKEGRGRRVWVILNLSQDIEFGSDYYASEDFQLLMKRRK